MSDSVAEETTIRVIEIPHVAAGMIVCVTPTEATRLLQVTDSQQQPYIWDGVAWEARNVEEGALWVSLMFLTDGAHCVVALRVKEAPTP